MTINFSKTDFCTILKKQHKFFKSIIDQTNHADTLLSCSPLSRCIIIPLFDEVSDSQFNLLWIFKLGFCDWWSEIRKMDESTLACCHKKLKLIFKWREFNKLHDLGFSVVYLISKVFFHHLLFLWTLSSAHFPMFEWNLSRFDTPIYKGLVNAWTEYIC